MLKKKKHLEHLSKSIAIHWKPVLWWSLLHRQYLQYKFLQYFATKQTKKVNK